MQCLSLIVCTGKKEFLQAVKGVLGRTPAILLSRMLHEGRKQELQFVATWCWRLLLLSLAARCVHIVWETMCCRARMSMLYTARKLAPATPLADTHEPASSSASGGTGRSQSEGQPEGHASGSSDEG